MNERKQEQRRTVRRHRVLTWLTRKSRDHASQAVHASDPATRAMHSAKAAVLADMVHDFATESSP